MHQTIYEAALKSIAILGFSFWIGEASKKLKWRMLTGPETLHLFSKLNIATQFPDLKQKDRKQELWTVLLEINQLLPTKPSQMTDKLIKSFESQSKSFVDKLVDLYPSKHVMPDLHCMYKNIYEFMEVHGSILQSTQQGLKKYNDTMTKDYFRSTSYQVKQT